MNLLPTSVGCAVRTQSTHVTPYSLSPIARARCTLHRSSIAAQLIALLALVILLPGCASTTNKRGPDPFNIAEQADKAYARGDWLVAERYYKELTREVPKDAYGWTRLGNIRLRQNKFEEAVHAYEAAIEREPEAPRAHYNLATAHLLLARNALEKAREHLPLNDDGARIIEDKLGHFDELIYEPLVDVTSPNEGLIRSRKDEQAPMSRRGSGSNGR